ncbi:MAG: hypothetical protein EOP50_20685, partial [Sphingobacteriales bacterium]
MAQEGQAPVNHNPFVKNNGAKASKKTTVIPLPFFEDFNGPGQSPDPSRWLDVHVYVNNTMAFNPVSRGVATFDALNAKGGPYDSLSNTAYRYADSLTSQPFDFTLYTPADSIYLSFFIQPQGNGFAPETQDSMILYFKRSNGAWAKVWS